MDDGDLWNRVVGGGGIEGGTRIPLWSLTNKELLTLVPPSVTIDVRADVCQTRKKDGRCLSIFFPSLWKRPAAEFGIKAFAPPTMNGVIDLESCSTYFPLQTNWNDIL